MIPFTSLLALGLAASSGASSGATTSLDASYIDASVRIDGSLLDWQFVDIEGDGPKELGLAVRTDRGERELRFHRMTAKAIEPEPFRTIPILKDIIAWTIADVRPDLEGNELVLLTRQGAWSFDPRLSEYKGNIRKLCEMDLLYDVPSPRELPYWNYVLEAEDGSDLLLLPQRGGFRIFGPRPAAAPAEDGELPWRALSTFQGTSDSAPNDPEDQERRAAEAKRDGRQRRVRLSATVGDSLRPFLGSGSTQSLVDDSFRIQAPALVDVNGDGRRDMLLLDGKQLRVHLSGPGGIPREPSRVETVPDYLTHDNTKAAMRLVDINGDGRLDILGIWSEDVDGFENAEWRIYVMLSGKDQLLPEKPNQVLRFTAAELRATVTDVDGDGRPDLALRSFELPTMLETVTGLEFTYSHLMYLGEKNGTFSRRPALKQSQTFDEEGVAAVLANRVLKMDCSGDGVADLVEVNLAGELGVRRLRKESSFFSGDSWSIDDGYWKKYSSRGSVTSLSVVDLNGDGLGDIVSGSESILTVYLSQER
ncbi:FG-GAP repeat protein [Planctomycetes bacterium Poly30]|uniref:FG-GAP repeat protein n=1 Tax=Saltatorellus ferox TaxID=2528018 RepID=A0A518EW51_9BACT|nr:FG-GAP repeat protein [Planctomycetes bacterium Poly30]